MSNTPITSVRIPTDVKKAAQQRAKGEGKTLSDVVVVFLKQYGDGVDATGYRSTSQVD